MKKLFLCAMALMGAIASNAQVVSEAISATLQKGETTTVYYGTNAFQTAMNNAADGSVITLSSGIFAAPGNITKSVKIYGAGYEDDPVTGVRQTYVNGNLNMNGVNDEHVDNLYVEGIWFTGPLYVANAADDELIEGIKVVKCRIGGIDLRENSQSTIIRQCFVEGNVSGNNTLASGFMLQNCYVTGAVDGFNTESAIVVDHCILTAADGRNTDYFHGPYYYKNTTVYRFLRTGAVVVNCVGAANFLSCGGTNTVINCYTDFKWGTLFADGQDNLNYMLADNSAPRTWELAKPEKFKGEDGTPVGVTGGTYAWDKIPSTPRIVSSVIDSKTVDGKLHVNIKAEARPVVE